MADLRRKWSTIRKAAPAPTKQRHFAISRHVSTRVAAYACFTCNALRLFDTRPKRDVITNLLSYSTTPKKASVARKRLRKNFNLDDHF